MFSLVFILCMHCFFCGSIGIVQHYIVCVCAKFVNGYLAINGHSLVPRPHPLTRRNSLVNQVEFLGLAHTFATM